MTRRICYIANPAWPHVEKWVGWFGNSDDIDLHIISERRPDYDASWHPFEPRFAQYPGCWMAGSVFEYRRLFKRIKPDLVHLHNLEDGMVPAALAWDGPMVITTYGLDVVRFNEVSPSLLRKASKRYVLRKADVVTSASSFLADVTSEVGRIPRSKVRVVPFGVDTGRFDPGKDREHYDAFTIGMAKDYKVEYGVLDFVKAISILHQKYCHIRAVMVGEGPLRREVESLASDLGVGDVLEVRDRVPLSEMVAMYQQFDVCVMPSLHESFGVAALEAQSMEVPVVASGVEGLREVLLDGRTGFLTPPSAPWEVARAIEQFIADPSLRESMGRAGRAFVKEKYEWGDCARLMDGIYGECIESAGGAA